MQSVKKVKCKKSVLAGDRHVYEVYTLSTEGEYSRGVRIHDVQVNMVLGTIICSGTSQPANLLALDNTGRREDARSEAAARVRTTTTTRVIYARLQWWGRLLATEIGNAKKHRFRFETISNRILRNHIEKDDDVEDAITEIDVEFGSNFENFRDHRSSFMRRYTTQYFMCSAF